MSHGCAMTRCPRCGYEFVENGSVTTKVRNWWTSFVTLVGEAAERRREGVPTADSRQPERPK